MFHFISFDLFFFLPLRVLIFFIIPPVSQLVALSVSLNAVWVKPKRWFLERDVPQMFAFFLIHLALALWKMNFLRWKKHFVTFFQDRYIVMRSIRHGMVFFSSSKKPFFNDGIPSRCNSENCWHSIAFGAVECCSRLNDLWIDKCVNYYPQISNGIDNEHLMGRCVSRLSLLSVASEEIPR